MSGMEILINHPQNWDSVYEPGSENMVLSRKPPDLTDQNKDFIN